MCRNRCNTCDECVQPQNASNKTFIIPVAGASSYSEWLSYYPELDPTINPESPWTEKYWVDNWTKGQKGDKGDGVQIKGSVPTYADLASITPTPNKGDSYIVDSDGLLYIYGEFGFPTQGQGIEIKGEAGDTYIPITTTNYFDQ